jgi:hypothetical protein
MSIDRCICCGEIIPEGRQVCWNCEQNGGPKVQENTPSETQIELVDKIADTLGIDFPWSSEDFTAQTYWKFINDNIEKAKTIWTNDFR